MTQKLRIPYGFCDALVLHVSAVRDTIMHTATPRRGMASSADRRRERNLISQKPLPLSHWPILGGVFICDERITVAGRVRMPIS